MGIKLGKEQGDSGAWLDLSNCSQIFSNDAPCVNYDIVSIRRNKSRYIAVARLLKAHCPTSVGILAIITVMLPNQYVRSTVVIILNLS